MGQPDPEWSHWEPHVRGDLETEWLQSSTQPLTVWRPLDLGEDCVNATGSKRRLCRISRDPTVLIISESS